MTEVEISSKSDEVECFYSVSSFGRYIDGMLEVIIGPCLGEFGDINIEKEIIPLTKFQIYPDYLTKEELGTRKDVLKGQFKLDREPAYIKSSHEKKIVVSSKK